MQRMQGVVQPYAWGSRTAIPALLGQEPTGEPQAELWLGAHPAGASTLDAEPLDAYVAREPERYVGARAVERFGPRLPYLIKVLAAERPLSLQAHPTREQAEAGFAREAADGVQKGKRVYSDDWPKPEAICALEDFEALCGFRDPATTYDLLRRLGVAAPGDLFAPLRDGSAGGLREVFARLLRLPEPAAVLDPVLAAARRVSDDAHAPADLRDLARTARELAEWYPDDPGVLAALLLNRVTLRRHEALFLPAGNLHSYLRGSGIEIMANSDNVLRGGLTAKPIAIEELLAIINFGAEVPAPVPCLEEASGVWRYVTPAPEFALWRLEVADSVAVPGTGSGRVLLLTEGEVEARSQSTLSLDQGAAAFLTADEQVELAGTGRAYLAAAGV